MAEGGVWASREPKGRVQVPPASMSPAGACAEQGLSQHMAGVGVGQEGGDVPGEAPGRREKGVPGEAPPGTGLRRSQTAPEAGPGPWAEGQPGEGVHGTTGQSRGCEGTARLLRSPQTPVNHRFRGDSGCQEGEGPQAGPCWGEARSPRILSTWTCGHSPPSKAAAARAGGPGPRPLSCGQSTREARQMRWRLRKLPSSWASRLTWWVQRCDPSGEMPRPPWPCHQDEPGGRGRGPGQSRQDSRRPARASGSGAT